MSPVVDTYASISQRSEGLYKELGSRFISFAYPVETEAQVRDIVEGLKREYHDARHHCYAYRLGLKGERFRAVDDGEPSSSAGRPILGQIDSAGLSDVLIVVVRYFGGIKLGLPGLIRAYRAAAQDALSSAEVVQKVAARSYSLCFDYLSMNDVMRLVKDLTLPVISQDYAQQRCSLQVRVRLSLDTAFRERVSNIGGCELDEI